MKSKPTKLAIITILILVLAGATAFYALSRRQTDPSDSTPATAKSDFTSNDSVKQENATDNVEGTATVDDNAGEQTDGEQTIAAESESIKLFSPTKNSILSSGSVISGESSLVTVNYRINDSTTGQIASGQLAVKDGKFSGTITVNTQADKGQIDIFGTKDNGNEFSNISLPVRFK